MAGEFDKDFGYLMPFLDKVTGAATTLADPAARAELTRLMADEKARWARIRELLGGAAGRAATTPAAAVSGQTNNSPALAPAEARETLSFTVGSLRPRRT